MGRPRGANGRKPAVAKVALEIHSFLEAGKTRNATTLEMVLLMLRNRALAGDARCLTFLVDLERRYAPDETKPAGTLYLPPPISPEDWEAMAWEQQRKYRTPGAARDDGPSDV